MLSIPAAAATADYRPPGVLALAVFTRDRHTCVYCGAVGGDLSIDHVRPVSWFRVGTARAVVNAPANLATACSACNSERKGALDLAAFAAKLRALGVPARAVASMVRRVAAVTARPLPVG